MIFCARQTPPRIGIIYRSKVNYHGKSSASSHYKSQQVKIDGSYIFLQDDQHNTTQERGTPQYKVCLSKIVSEGA